MADEERELTQDLAATVEARRDLGPAYEAELVQSFVERLDKAVERRVSEELERRGAAEEDDDDGPSGSFIVALTSLGTGIPITAIAENQGLLGIAAAWAGIVGVNAVYAWVRRRS